MPTCTASLYRICFWHISYFHSRWFKKMQKIERVKKVLHKSKEKRAHDAWGLIYQILYKTSTTFVHKFMHQKCHIYHMSMHSFLQSPWINPTHSKLICSYIAMLICIKKRPHIAIYGKQPPWKRYSTVACSWCCLFQTTWNMPKGQRR